jgi:hypothetical protein
MLPDEGRRPPATRPADPESLASKADLNEVKNEAACFSDASPCIVNKEDTGCEADKTLKSEADLAALLSNLEARLLDAFNEKLAFDNFKEKQIDRLHEELQGYKSDLLLKAAQPLTNAMIKLYADVARVISGLSREDPTKLTVDRVVGLFDSLRVEIADLLAARGVEMFHAAVDDRFDARRQSSVGSVETSSSERVGRIA